MAPHTSWEHLSSPEQIRQRSKALAAEQTDMLSRLVDIRKNRGMTQADVANILGVTQQSISKLESYDANPRLDTLRTYANAIGAILHIEVKEDSNKGSSHLSEDQWESSDRFPRSTVPGPCKYQTVRHIHDWSEKEEYLADSTRIDFVLSA